MDFWGKVKTSQLAGPIENALYFVHCFAIIAKVA